MPPSFKVEQLIGKGTCETGDFHVELQAHLVTSVSKIGAHNMSSRASLSCVLQRQEICFEAVRLTVQQLKFVSLDVLNGKGFRGTVKDPTPFPLLLAQSGSCRSETLRRNPKYRWIGDATDLFS